MEKKEGKIREGHGGKIEREERERSKLRQVERSVDIWRREKKEER